MALSLNANWLAAMQRADVAPVFLCTLDVSASVQFKFVSSPNTSIEHPASLSNVTPIASKLDPIKRTATVSSIHLQFVNDGHLRNVINNNRIRGKRIIVELGEERLAEADYEPYFRGVVEDIIPGDGTITIITKDVFKLLKDRKVSGTFSNTHPLEAISTILTSAGVPADLIDSTSLDPDTYTSSISHWAIMRGVAAQSDTTLAGFNVGEYSVSPSSSKTGGKEIDITEPDWGEVASKADDGVNSKQLIQELALLMHGSLVPTEEGKLAFNRFDASAAADDDWTADDWSGFEQLTTFNNITNRAFIEAFHDSESDSFGKRVMHGNTDSQTNYAYPGESDQIFERAFSTKWVNATSTLSGSLAAGATTVVLAGGNLDSFAGMRDDGSSGWTSTSTRKVYLYVVDPANVFQQGTKSEVIECSTATLDSTVKNEDGNTVKVTYTVNTNGRKFTEGGSATGRGFTSGSVVWDITILIDWAVALIERLSDGMPVIRVRTSLAKYGTQLTDLITLAGVNTFLTFGKDGLDGSDKWEVVGKEDSSLGDTPGLLWTLAKATSVTGYTEEWEPEGTDSVLGPDDNSGPNGPWKGYFDKDIFWDRIVRDGGIIDSFVSRTADVGGLIGTGPHGGFANAGLTAHSFTASKDTYITADSISSRFNFYEVANGAGVPTFAEGDVEVGLIETDASAITTSDSAAADRRSIIADKSLSPDDMNPKGPIGDKFTGGRVTKRPPIGWRMMSGAWKTDADEDTSTLLSGTRSLQMLATTPAADPEFVGDPVPIEASQWYEFSAYIQASSTTAGNTVKVVIQWLDKDKVTQVGSDQTVHNAVVSAVDTWERKIAVLQVNSSAFYYRWVLGKNNTAFTANIDRVEHKTHNAQCFLGLNGDQSAVAKATKVTLDRNPIDTVGGFQSGSNDYDIETGQAGSYMVSATARIQNLAGAAGERLAVQIRVNGTATAQAVVQHPNSLDVTVPVAATLHDASEGDTFDLFINTVVDSTYTIVADFTHLTIQRITPEVL